MTSYPVHVVFPGRLIFVGFGSIGQGVLPLILRHIGIKPEQITIVTADERGAKEAAANTASRFVEEALTRENFKKCSSRWSAGATSCSTSRSTCRRSR